MSSTPDTDIWALHVTEFEDDYKLRGEDASCTTTWYFDDPAKAHCQLHRWFKERVLGDYEITVEEIEEKCKEEIPDFEMKDWCFGNGVPLDDCPDINKLLNAVLPAEFTTRKFRVEGPYELILTNRDIVKDQPEGCEFIRSPEKRTTKKRKSVKE